MNERKLLEAAAKAAGVSVSLIDVGSWCGNGWNPMLKDGDALRLAVRLGMTIRIDTRAGFSWVKGFEGSEPHGSDPAAATRRAIVRAAAAMAG